MNLREALFSEYNAETLWRICEGQHLSDDKIEKVATLVGDVILGFLHPEDLAQEIRKDINIVPEIANVIASEIDRKIFTPIRSDLEKVYSPAVALAEEGAPPSAEVETEERGPEIIESEKPTVTEIRKPEAPIKIVEEKEVEQPVLSRAEGPKIITPEEKPEEIQYEEVQLPKEIELSKAIEDRPLILHKETELKPLSDTKKSLKSLGGLFDFLKKGKEKKEERPVRAEVEGIETKPPKIEEIKPVETKVKVVNYTETPEQETKKSQESIEAVKQAEMEVNKEQKGEEMIDLGKL